MQLDQLNFHAIKCFLSVYRHKSSSLAAVELGLTNSAVSRCLKVLREIFEDELFIRTNSGFVPTEKAVELAPKIEQLVIGFNALCKDQNTFDPKKAEGTFELRVYDEFSYAVQEVIDKLIKPQAPKLKFVIRILTYNCVPELVSGAVDFAVVYEGFDDKRLNFERFSSPNNIYILCRQDHPLMKLGNVTVDEIAKYPLVEIDNYRDLECPLLVDICRESGKVMEVQGYTESVASAFRAISQSNAIAVMCNQFTRQFADMFPGLAYVKLPNNILDRIKAKRSETKPIGNYLAYGNASQSPAFNWVKDELIQGLKHAWDQATLNNSR